MRRQTVKWRVMRRMLAALLALIFMLPALARADEGMWTLDNFPTSQVATAYGFTATPAFLTKVRQAAVRLPGCSGSFLSKNGLVMTNQHCARARVQAI